MDELNSTLAALEEMVVQKGQENHALEAELDQLRSAVTAQEAELEQLVRAEEEGRATRRLEAMMRKNRLGEQLREQEQVMELLQLQIQTFLTSTFPTLG
jgi:predicted RNase H-like nuclease (RuvC/YqgF family)